MQTIRKRLSILFFICSFTAILLIALFVNITLNSKFNQYMVDIQNKRFERIVSYLEDIYEQEGGWSENSGLELMHEAYMGNYCLTLKDKNKKLLWGMNPDDIKSKLNLNAMPVKNRGVYTSRTFEIKSGGNVVGYVDIGQYSSVLMSEEDMDFKASINKSIVASGILTLIAITVLSLYISKQFSIPIKEVANMSANLSEGNFDAKYSAKSNIKEIENLRNSVNILAEKLKNQDMIRKRLVSDISHEIRTPLNILQNNLEAMIDGVFPVTKERLNYLNEEVIRFGRLLNDLDALKKFESENIKLDFETIALDGLIEGICRDFYIAAENKNIELKYHAEPGDYHMAGDADKLKQVFINLISNAIKFTNTKGRVSVKLHSDKDDIIVEVEDNGVGIKSEDLPFIFERLYRGDKSRNQTEGSGIGLTIAKHILELHGAVIAVKSREGEGTSFKICFKRNTENKIIE